MNLALSFLIFTLLISSIICYTCPATCIPANNCKCASKLIPGNVPWAQTPQFVFFTIDDAVVVPSTTYSMLPKVEFYRNDPTIRDKNGCPIRPTIYTLSKNSDYSIIAYFEKIGTVALHTVTHTTDFNTNYQKWKNELQTCWADMKELAKVKNIYGSRAPYLETNNDYYKSLKELNVLFDSSSSWYPKAYTVGEPASERRNYWPFTLDYGFPEEGLAYSSNMYIPQSVNGLWEVPMTGYQKTDTDVYDIMDYDISNRAKAMADLKADFDYNYNANKAPLGYYFHVYYFLDENGNVDANKLDFWAEFLRYVASKDNVLFATEDRAIAWVKNPKQTFAETKAMPEFQCNDFPTPDNACYDDSAAHPKNNPYPITTCVNPTPIDGRPTYTICGDSCPNELPQLNSIWKYSNPAKTRVFTNDVAYIDTPYQGKTANAGYPKFLGKVELEFIEGTSTPAANNWGLNGKVCASILVTNPSSLYGANGFIVTVDWCLANAKLLSFDTKRINSKGGKKVDFTEKTNNGFRFTGTIQDAFMRYEAFDFGTFCLTVNTNNKKNFKWGNIKAGIDFFRVPLFCDLASTSASNKCTVYCGNLSCTSGENANNCPIDCSKTNICQ